MVSAHFEYGEWSEAAARRVLDYGLVTIGPGMMGALKVARDLKQHE